MAEQLKLVSGKAGTTSEREQELQASLERWVHLLRQTCVSCALYSYGHILGRFGCFVLLARSINQT